MNLSACLRHEHDYTVAEKTHFRLSHFFYALLVIIATLKCMGSDIA